MAPKKLDCLSTPDNYQIYQGSSINGSIKRNYYYINGVKCNALGQISGDPGYNINNRKGEHVPISYPNYKQNIRTSGKKKKYPQLWGLSSSDLLQLQKQNIENSVGNKTRENINTNKRTKWEKKNHFSHNYPPTPSFPPYPSNRYIIPTSHRKVYYVFPWSKIKVYN